MVYGSNPGLSVLKVISFGFGLLLTEHCVTEGVGKVPMRSDHTSLTRFQY